MQDIKTQDGGSDDAKRLRQLIKAGRVIPYLVDNADREHPSVRWCVYGAPDSGELFVSATSGSTVVVRAVKSELVYPPMADRIFGIDVRDLRTAGDVSAAIWRDCRAELLPRS